MNGLKLRLFITLGNMFLLGNGQCLHSEDVVHCDNAAFDSIMINNSVRTVVLRNVDVSKLKEGVFKLYANWSNVEHLQIFGKEGNMLSPKVFLGLDNLKTLHIQHEGIKYFSSDVFEGLSKVQTLKLINIYKLRPERIHASIYKAPFSRLEKIVIQKVGVERQLPFILNGRFFFSITRNGSRQLRSVEIFNVTISELNYKNILRYNLCNTLKNVVIRNCVISSLANYIWFQPCRSLQSIDISGTFLPALAFDITPQYTRFTCLATFLFFTTEEFFFNDMLKRNLSYDLTIRDYLLDLSACPMQIRKLSAKRNTLRWLDVSVKLHPTTADSFEWADVSDNLIEYISPDLLQPSRNIRHLDLANNKLHVMQDKYHEEFRVLFQTQTKLEYISIARNSLVKLPHNIFETNKNLVYLDVSYNYLVTLEFLSVRLPKLQILHLAGNPIKVLEANNKANLESVLSSPVAVYLGSNSHTCSCEEENVLLRSFLENDAVIEEFVSYVCMLENIQTDIFKGDSEKLTEYCKWQEEKVYLSISVPVVTLLMTIYIVVHCMVIHRRRHREQQVLKADNVRRNIHLKCFPKKYLAFVSFCSEDNAVVTNHILPSLKQTLKFLLQTNHDLIAYGDTAFRPGYPLNEEIIKCVGESAIILLVVSQEFCKKRWCQEEFREANMQNKPIILIMLEKVDKSVMGENLSKIYENFTHARWFDDEKGGRLEPEWLHFCKAMIALASEAEKSQTNKIKRNYCDFVASKPSLSGELP